MENPFILYRIQDRRGRGPFKPGESQKWISKDSTVDLLPPVYLEVDNFRQIVAAAHLRGLHVGIAVRGIDGLRKWFLREELETLKKRGYRVVDCTRCEVLKETPNQVIIGWERPLADLFRLNWAHILTAVA